MITDSFDNKTEPIFTLKDFYGERKMMLDTCVIIFSKEIYETVLTTYSCTKITEINAVNGAVPIYEFGHEGKEIALIDIMKVLNESFAEMNELVMAMDEIIGEILNFVETQKNSAISSHLGECAQTLMGTIAQF